MLVHLAQKNILYLQTHYGASIVGEDERIMFKKRMKLVGIMDAAGFKEQVMAARDRFQNARHHGVVASAPAGDEVVTALRDIHVSLEGLRQELRERG